MNDDLIDYTQIEVAFAGGKVVTGTLRFSQKHGWVQDAADLNTYIVIGPAADPNIISIRALRSAADVIREREELKYGERAYEQPTTRNEYESVIWGLALMIRRYQDLPFEQRTARRGMQLEAQFDRVCDEIQLAKPKRRYVQARCVSWSQGRPFVHPQEFTEGPDDAKLFEIPKPTDFDPDPKVRRKRRLKPAAAYWTRSELEWSLNNARSRLNGRLNARKRAMYEKIVQKRLRELSRGLYREAIEQMQSQAQNA